MRIENSHRGFSLIEMLIAVGIFAVIVMVAVDMTLIASNAQIKASNTQAVQDNIRFGLELLAKELRTGNQYQILNICTTAGTNEEIHFTDTVGPRVYYLRDDGIIMRATSAVTSSAQCSGGASDKFKPFTADEVLIEKLRFDLRGQTTGPTDGQPMVTIVLGVSARNPKPGLSFSMNLQTTVVQRLRDAAP